MVVQLDQLGDGRVEAHRVHVGAHALDRAVQHPVGGVVERRQVAAQRAGVFVDEVAPHALQEPVHAHHVAGLPRAGSIERAHGHLVQAQRVGAVGLVDHIGRNGVLQALAHLAPLAGDRLALVEELAVALFHTERVDVDLAFVLERRRQDVALVEQAVVRLLRRQVAQVEQHLVPEAGVQQVQHGVLDTADVQVDTARMTVALGPHPVLLDRGVDEAVGVGGVEVAQLVPAAACPLRHHVGVAVVALRAVAQVEQRVRPVGQSVERALGVAHRVVGIERARAEAVGGR